MNPSTLVSRIWLTPPDVKPEVAKVATNFSSRHLCEVWTKAVTEWQSNSGTEKARQWLDLSLIKSCFNLDTKHKNLNFFQVQTWIYVGKSIIDADVKRLCPLAWISPALCSQCKSPQIPKKWTQTGKHKIPRQKKGNEMPGGRKQAKSVILILPKRLRLRNWLCNMQACVRVKWEGFNANFDKRW